jgi:dihydroflavonol-4-reductase
VNLTLQQMLELLGRLTGKQPPRLKLPHWIPLAIAHLEAPLSRLLGRDPRVPLDGVRMSKSVMFFDPSKAVRELGFPQSPIEPAFERAVSWFIDHDYAPARAARVSSPVAAT